MISWPNLMSELRKGKVLLGIMLTDKPYRDITCRSETYRRQNIDGPKPIGWTKPIGGQNPIGWTGKRKDRNIRKVWKVRRNAKNERTGRKDKKGRKLKMVRN